MFIFLPLHTDFEDCNLRKTNRYTVIGMLTALICIMLAIPVAHATLGTGQLIVYTDTSVEAPQGDPHGDTYLVNPGATYHIHIWNITEFNTGDLLTVKICWTDNTNASRTTFFHNVPVLETGGIKFVEVDWTVPADGKICTTCTVHYTQAGTSEYIAIGLISNVGHMHTVPETLLGTIGTLLALFGAVSLFFVHKTKKP